MSSRTLRWFSASILAGLGLGCPRAPIEPSATPTADASFRREPAVENQQVSDAPGLAALSSDGPTDSHGDEARKTRVDRSSRAGLPAEARTPKARAAWGMLQYLHMVGTFARRAGAEVCSSAALTFGMAKTDPWGNDFIVSCSPEGISIASPGPDGRVGTADDIDGAEPFVSGTEACESACKRAEACASSFATECSERCAKVEDPRMHFALDTCAALRECEDVTRCFGRAEAYLKRPCRPEASLPCSPAIIDAGCDAFVRIAARLARARPADHPKLLAACEDYGTAWAHDLVCLEASRTLEEAARCHLTVYRRWIDPYVKH
jgi:hypothetical protein